ncbi:hypothetical protein [Metabacillus fastidiosus]|uniref:hypothetical protein n=1 Tax=Metabacillus fastidiosus TaxID=1458 RepID=UPI000A941F8D
MINIIYFKINIIVHQPKQKNDKQTHAYIYWLETNNKHIIKKVKNLFTVSNTLLTFNIIMTIIQQQT